MNKVLIIIDSGFELIETLSVVDVLRALHIETHLCSMNDKLVKSFRDVKINCDIVFSDVNSEDYSCIVFPGGPAADELMKNKHLLSFTKSFFEKGKLVAAICGGPQILSYADVVAEKRATSHPKVKNNICCKEYVDEPVVIDDNVITSQSPVTALGFAFAIAESLIGKDACKEVKDNFLFE
ncbi:DJ-1 family glyoxalase III [Oceanirhabdus seepicola]|uniref:DJ-1/PfpI family protein n=1 Tax=Oceanirhabdus seepicola TaxID=2828781 RepID=A0A9J6P6T7_9CLOT|nr:DJ-1 family glyoxalase III [Oceanirhabdus seepicola]MCM1991980.1 DJ-1/PfpI family protein [Oceanirhabdus seepicola]